MTDKGMIFSAPMVRALLDGRKTQTRRLLSLRGYRGFSEFGPSDTPGYDWHFRRKDACWCDMRTDRLRTLLPYSVGDRLYVREAHAVVGSADPGWVLYRASGYDAECERHGFDEHSIPPESEVRWTPSIHMPRWASRLTLTVTDVRVQRVQEISEDDAVAEGVGEPYLGDGDPPFEEPGAMVPSSIQFRNLWNSLHGKPGERWEDDPWVCVISFSVRHGNIDQ